MIPALYSLFTPPLICSFTSFLSAVEISLFVSVILSLSHLYIFLQILLEMCFLQLRQISPMPFFLRQDTTTCFRSWYILLDIPAENCYTIVISFGWCLKHSLTFPRAGGCFLFFILCSYFFIINNTLYYWNYLPIVSKCFYLFLTMT